MAGCAILLAAAAPDARAQSMRVTEDPEELDRRARADSNDPAAQYNAAMGWWSRQRYERADSALARAVELDPSFAAGWLARSVVHDRNDRFWNLVRRRGDTAFTAEVRRRESYYRRAFLLDPFVDVRVLGSVRRLPPHLTYLGQGLMHLIEGRYADAFERLEQVVRRESQRGIDSLPEFVLWLHQLAAARANQVPVAVTSAEALLRKSQAREASDTVRAVPLETNQYRYILAALYARAGRRDDALRLFREVLTNDIGHYAAHTQLARLFESAGDFGNAVAERQRATNVNPDDHTLFIDLGTTLARASRWPEAETALQQATTMAPRDPRGFYRLGVVTQQLGKRPEARAAFERFIELAPARQANVIADARARLAQLSTP